MHGIFNSNTVTMCVQVEYIVQLENLRVVRHLAHLPQLNYSKEAKRNWFLAWKDKMTGVDYDTQAELVVELHESLQDSDGGSKVSIAVLLPGIPPSVKGNDLFLFSYHSHTE